MQPSFTSVAQVVYLSSHILQTTPAHFARLSNPSMVTGVMRLVCLGLHVADGVREMLNFSAFRDSIAGKSIAEERVPSYVSHRLLTRDFPGGGIHSWGFPSEK
jgi:hypothetical protein